MPRIIDLLEVNGPMVRMPYSEALGNGLFEIRIKQGTDISRVLYFFTAGRKIILTNGFVKKTQKVPVREINLARHTARITKGDIEMSSYERFREEQLRDSDVRAEYDALEPEFNIIQAMIDARKQQNMTQKELSERTGITQADISRIENGTRNPSINMVKRLAKGLGMQLKLELIPQRKTE